MSGLTAYAKENSRPTWCAPRFHVAATILGLALGGLAGCTDEVFVERALFDDPPDMTFNFLGYFDVAEKTTVCGNCHVGKQSGWEGTGHADAWDGLQASGAAQPFCEGCHTVSERGNALDEPAGYNLVAHERYEDVQCESCHGSGFEHVQNPDATQPLAPISVGVDLGTGCGDCHSGNHHPFVEQWSQSRHGTVPHQSSALSVGPFCLPCHEGKTALVSKFNETDDYIEKFDPAPQPLVCAVCHDPHGSPFTSNLRASIEDPSADNLCVTCHSRRGTPPSSHGPHAYQGLLVLGENVGWIPPGFQYDTARIVSTHGTEANPRLCATCHVAEFQVTDAESGEFLLASVGHTFEALTCLDAQGLPTAGPCTVAEQDFRACATSGCHGTEAAARSAFQVVKARIESLLDDIWTDSDGDSVIDGSDGGLLPKVVAQGDTSQLDVTDDIVTVAEGALWNAMLAHTDARPHFGDGQAFGIHFSAHKGSGEGVHNPFLLEALLTASISAVMNEYSITPSRMPDLSIHATQPPGVNRR